VNSQQVYDKEERKKRHSSAKKSSASLSARLQQRQREKERQRESPGSEGDLVMIEKTFSSYQIDSSFVVEEEGFQPVDVYADGKRIYSTTTNCYCYTLIIFSTIQIKIARKRIVNPRNNRVKTLKRVLLAPTKINVRKKINNYNSKTLEAWKKRKTTTFPSFRWFQFVINRKRKCSLSMCLILCQCFPIYENS
jgi:hypothetical protein